MTKFELATIVLSGFSILISICAIILAYISSKKVEKSNSAEVELAINERITNTKEKIIDFTKNIELSRKKKTSSKNKKMILFEKQLNSLIENNLNAYEEGCAKYIDKKIDKVRFKKTYKTEIKNLVEHKDYNKYFDAVTSQYKGILKVYKEWENLED